MIFTNTLYNTTPLVIHNHGPSPRQEIWETAIDHFLSSPQRIIGPSSEITIISFSTLHNDDLLINKCLHHLGIPSIIKPLSTQSASPFTPLREAAEEAHTPYLLFLHPHDAIILDNPLILTKRFEKHFPDTKLLFSGDLVSWPPLSTFMHFEKNLPDAQDSEFKHLNGGTWIGDTEFCRHFFKEAEACRSIKGLPHSPQAMLRQLFPRFHPQTQIDYRCILFQGVGFVNQPILNISFDPTNESAQQPI